MSRKSLSFTNLLTNIRNNSKEKSTGCDCSLPDFENPFQVTQNESINPVIQPIIAAHIVMNFGAVFENTSLMHGLDIFIFLALLIGV